jgi:hypothetical protein
MDAIVFEAAFAREAGKARTGPQARPANSDEVVVVPPDSFAVVPFATVYVDEKPMRALSERINLDGGEEDLDGECELQSVEVVLG